MRKCALLLAVLLAASFATNAEAAKKRAKVVKAKAPAVYSGDPTPEARAKALKGVIGLFLPTAVMLIYAHSDGSPYRE